MSRKYEILTGDYKTFIHPHTSRPISVNRIIFTRTFTWINPFTDQEYQIHEGTIGGFIESESNLSHDDTSVLLNNSVIFGSGRLIDSMLRDTSAVFDDGVLENCEVFGGARVFGRTTAKHCIFRDVCNVGGILELQRNYITNSAHISGVCRVYDTEMRVGSMIRGQSNVYDCTLTDVSEICGISTVKRCQLSGRCILKNARIENKTLHEDVELKFINGK